MLNNAAEISKEKAARATEAASCKSQDHNTFTYYRNQGLSVFPALYGQKKAAVKWKQYQTTAATLEQCGVWDGKSYNIAIGTGIISGIFVFDIDGEEGQKTLAALEEKYGALPATRMAKSGKKHGIHYYFRYPNDGREIRDLTGHSIDGEVLQGIDVRGDGGYIIAPPSLHPNGKNYEWLNDSDFAPAPEWLLELVAKRPSPEIPLQQEEGNSFSSVYLETALAGELAELRSATNGTRNNVLNKAAFSLGQLVPHGLSESRVAAELLQTATAIGLGTQEASATIASGIQSGIATPRDLDQQKREKSTKESQKPKTRTSYRASELQHLNFPPIKYIVTGYIVEGFTILAGKPKIGKSWFCLDVALAVACGGYAFGGIPCEEGDVLYLALEDNPRRLQSRIRAMLKYDRQIWPEKLQLETDWQRLDAGGIKRIIEWLDVAPQPRLVIIDTLAKVKGARNANNSAYEDDYKAIGELQTLAGEKGVAIVMVHHTRKMPADDPIETVSGTLGLAGAADSILVLDHKPNGVTLYGRGRDIEEIETALRFDKKNLIWRILGKASDVHRSDERQVILDCLAGSEEPMTPKEIAAALGIKENNTKQLLRKMLEKGEVEKSGKGKYHLPKNPDNSDNPDNPFAPDDCDDDPFGYRVITVIGGDDPQPTL